MTIISSTLFNNLLNALPACRDCNAEDVVCKSVALSCKLNCLALADAKHADAVITIKNKTEAGNNACDTEHGSGTLAGNLCRQLVGGIDADMRAIAWATNVSQQSVCRALYNFALGACDKAFYDCQRAVATERANCQCK